MKCPFLVGKYMYSCSASKEVYAPSAFEMEEYCKNTGFKLCPFYYMRIASDARIVTSSESTVGAGRTAGRDRTPV